MVSHHLQVFVFDALYVEADRGDSRYELPEFHLVQRSRFASSVQTKHEDALLFFLSESIKKFSEKVSHCLVCRDRNG